MSKIDTDQLKNALAARFKQRRGFSKLRWPAGIPGQSQTAISRPGVNQILKSFFAKAGLDIEKLDQLISHNQNEARLTFEKQVEEAAKHSVADEAALRRGLAGRQKALEILQKFHPGHPRVPSTIVLDQPFLIWQMPDFESSIFIDSTTEPMNSSVRFEINTNTGNALTQFNFYFLWRNESDGYAVLDASTSLVMNGLCEAGSASGILSGDDTQIIVTTELLPLQWWDQVGGQPTEPVPEQGQSRQIVSLFTSAGGLFSSAGFSAQLVSNALVDLNYQLFGVPSGATAVFEVSVAVQYSISGDGGDISDLVLIDFADKATNRSVICPSVTLQLLTD
jgi:hypothetical protein